MLNFRTTDKVANSALEHPGFGATRSQVTVLEHPVSSNNVAQATNRRSRLISQTTHYSMPPSSAQDQNRLSRVRERTRAAVVIYRKLIPQVCENLAARWPNTASPAE